MKLLVAADSIFHRTSDGKYWCKTIYSYNFWLRYLSVFSQIAIVSRVRKASYDEVDGFLRVDGPNVSILELPNMQGMKDYIKKYFIFIKHAQKAVEYGDCAIIRLPSVVSFMVYKYFKRTGKPFGIEVVADPYDAYKSNPIARNLYTTQLKKATKIANGVSYVTKDYLQMKYPSFSRLNGESKKYFETFFSTIDLPSSYFSKPKLDEGKKQYNIVHTANSINNNNKGHETVIKVLKKLRHKNYDCHVTFIGDGSKRKKFEKMSERLGLNKYITFTGILSSPNNVREELLKGDLFIFPTKAEGLPRALIEAMAVGLPCLSTPKNGIPELLSSEFLYPPNDVDGFTNKAIEIINSPKKYSEISKQNIEKAKHYEYSKLKERRDEFYLKLKEISNVESFE